VAEGNNTCPKLNLCLKYIFFGLKIKTHDAVTIRELAASLRSGSSPNRVSMRSSSFLWIDSKSESVTMIIVMIRTHQY
jgi:hypothetical protein